MIIVIVNATDFEMKVVKCLEMARREEIIITKNSKEIAKVVPIKKQGTSNVDFLYGLMENYPNKEVTIKQVREERISRYGSY